MFQQDNSRLISVDKIAQKIREEVARRHQASPNNYLNMTSHTTVVSSSLINYIKTLLKDAEFQSQVPASLPDKLDRFPFNIKIVRQTLLTIYGFLFKKQRVVNHDLIQAVKETLSVNQQLSEEVARLQSNINNLKSELAQQKRIITLFVEEAKLPAQDNQGKLQAIIDEEAHLLDAFYVALEDEFRGSRQEILNRCKIYLPLVEKANAGTEQFPIVDLGCGRGEWLELLQESGYACRGVDSNRVMIEQCQARGIEVVESNVIAYLRSLPDESVGAVTGFHIIEHLPFDVLIQLFDETVRVLKSGGVAIFETPNPENVLVGCCNFYLDPTHRHPLPSQLSQFIARSRGLSEVEIRYLHPSSEREAMPEAIAQRFNQYFYGAQDYAIIGYKL